MDGEEIDFGGISDADANSLEEVSELLRPITLRLDGVQIGSKAFERLTGSTGEQIKPGDCTGSGVGQ